MSARLVSAKTLAERYGVTMKDVSKWTRCGLLPVIRITKRSARYDLEQADRATAFSPTGARP